MKKLLATPFAKIGIKAKPQTAEAPFPRHEFGDRLDALLAAGRKAGVTAYEAAEALDRRADAVRLQIALSAPSDRSLY